MADPSRKKSSGAEMATRKTSFDVQMQRSAFESLLLEQKKISLTPVTEKAFIPKNITLCQAEKMTALFEKYFDVDHDGYLTEGDISALNEKIFAFTKWENKDIRVTRLVEYHADIFSCLLAEVNMDVILDEHKASKISLYEWMKMWDRLFHKSLSLAHLPQWVQVLPFNMFTFIDTDGESHVSKKNLYYFYKDFMGLDPTVAQTVAGHAYNEMTGNGDYFLNLDIYTIAFSNFLFGKSFHGPGIYILGTFEQCAKPRQYKLLHDNFTI